MAPNKIKRNSKSNDEHLSDGEPKKGPLVKYRNCHDNLNESPMSVGVQPLRLNRGMRNLNLRAQAINMMRLEITAYGPNKPHERSSGLHFTNNPSTGLLKAKRL